MEIHHPDPDPGLDRKTVKVLVRKEANATDLPLPAYMTKGSSGVDLYSAEPDNVVIQPREIRLISTGIRISLPQGYEAQIRPRSGLALKHGITLVNAPGTIDSDYRGVISLIMVNLSDKPFVVERGMRVAQMVIQEFVSADFEMVTELDQTARSTGGFGHTGH